MEDDIITQEKKYEMWIWKVVGRPSEFTPKRHKDIYVKYRKEFGMSYVIHLVYDTFSTYYMPPIYDHSVPNTSP